MHSLVRKTLPAAVGILCCTVWISSAAADTFCSELTKIVAQSGDFESLKGEPVEGERFAAKTVMSGFRQCTVSPFRTTFSYTCETAPEVNAASAEKKWNEIGAGLGNCLKGDWMSRNAGKQNIFFADRKKGEAVSLSLREVAGFKREGNQLKTFPTYYNRLVVFPRKKMTKKSAN